MPSPILLAATGLLALALALAVALTLELRRFLATTPALTSVSGVIAFQRMVARQMYGTLAVITLTVAAAVVMTAGIYSGLAEWREVPIVLAVAAAFTVPGVWSRVVEARAKSIPVVDDEIARERDAVVRVWRSRPLPKW